MTPAHTCVVLCCRGGSNFITSQQSWLEQLSYIDKALTALGTAVCVFVFVYAHAHKVAQWWGRNDVPNTSE